MFYGFIFDGYVIYICKYFMLESYPSLCPVAPVKVAIAYGFCNVL
jgi:hypothetical protein